MRPSIFSSMGVHLTDQGQREHVLAGVRRVVLKVGTRLLTDIPGRSKTERVAELIAAIAALRERGLEVLLVSSGAIGAGMTVLSTDRRPRSLPRLQAYAAVGQSRLMYLYETACVNRGFHCAQLLLTAGDLKAHERHKNAINCIDALLAAGVLPVVNENDSVSVDEIRFGDNDTLAALVASMIRADLTILLTSIDGMHLREGDAWGERISVIEKVTPEVRAMAGATDGNPFSVGGMTSKLKAAEVLARAGDPLIVADGREFTIIDRVLGGEDVGTLFPATATTRMRGRRRYVAFFSNPKGDLVIDDGAVRALRDEGRSLLPSGIRDVRGTFERGATVRILAPDKSEIARGETNFSSREIAAIKGHHSDQSHDILGYAGYDEVVHRDYLVLSDV